MKTKNKLPKDLVKGAADGLEFRISPRMAERFIKLIGDCSSLHTDTAFARRSIYRENVIHGMLPVMFIPALRPCLPEGAVATYRKISARFLKPIFFGKKFLLRYEISEVDEKNAEIELRFALKNAETQAVHTTGVVSLEYGESAEGTGPAAQAGENDLDKCIVAGPLKEEELRFEDISKGDERTLDFFISRVHAKRLFEILQEGSLSNLKGNLASWMTSCDTANLLSASLFSTFVGMRMPGRHATFLDFSVVFEKPIEWECEYQLKGTVSFKSESTASIVEDMSIWDRNGTKIPRARGRINAKVNSPAIEMPSIEYLKKNAMDMQIKDKVVLVTGSSRGIGETTAKLFSLYGAKLIINYFQGKDDAERVVRDITTSGGIACAIRADVSDREEVRKMISIAREKYGTVDILVNNAVRDAFAAPFRELTWDDFQKAIDVAVKGAFNCCQEIIPIMLEKKAGKIVNISTIYADNPPPNQAKYVVAKGGLASLTRSLAIEFAPFNIQVNMVVPSIVETDLSKHVPRMHLEGMKNDTPMKRNATAVDVARAVIFLASSLSSFTTGQKIMVTGGNPPFL